MGFFGGQGWTAKPAAPAGNSFGGSTTSGTGGYSAPLAPAPARPSGPGPSAPSSGGGAAPAPGAPAAPKGGGVSLPQQLLRQTAAGVSLWDQATTIVGSAAKAGLDPLKLLSAVQNPDPGLRGAVQYAIAHPEAVRQSSESKVGGAISQGGAGIRAALSPIAAVKLPVSASTSGIISSPRGASVPSAGGPIAAVNDIGAQIGKVFGGSSPSPKSQSQSLSVLPYGPGQVNQLIAGINAKTGGNPITLPQTAPKTLAQSIAAIQQSGASPQMAKSLAQQLVTPWSNTLQATPPPGLAQSPGVSQYGPVNAVIHGIVDAANAAGKAGAPQARAGLGAAALQVAANANKQPAPAAAQKLAQAAGLGSSGASGVISSPNGLTVKGAPMTATQQHYANQIIQIGKQLGAPPTAIQAALYAAMGETSLGGDTSALTSPNSSGYWGLMQGSTQNWPNPSDSAGMVRSFFLGGKGFNSGGAINLAKQGVSNPAQIAVQVEVPSIWPNNAYASQWPGGAQQGVQEAGALLKAATGQASGYGAGLGSAAGTGFQTPSGPNTSLGTLAASGSGSPGTVSQGTGAGAGSSGSASAPSSGNQAILQAAGLAAPTGTASNPMTNVLNSYFANTPTSLWNVGAGTKGLGISTAGLATATSALQSLAGSTKLTAPAGLSSRDLTGGLNTASKRYISTLTR